MVKGLDLGVSGYHTTGTLLLLFLPLKFISSLYFSIKFVLGKDGDRKSVV